MAHDTDPDHLKDAAVSIRAGGVRVSVPAALVLSFVTLCGGGIFGASLASKDEGKPVPIDDVREIKADLKSVLVRLGRCESAIDTQTARIDALYKAQQ